MVKKICNSILTVVLTVIIAVGGALVLPKAFGYEIFAVKSGSMEPSYHVGSVVYVKQSKPEAVKIGDPISFYMAGQDKVVATHRVVGINTQERAFKTKGDANEVEDMVPQSFDNLIGVVQFTIPLLGFVTMYVKTGEGIIVVCAILILIVLLSVIPELFGKKPNKAKS